MPVSMDWNKLMCRKRLCNNSIFAQNQARTEFQKDYDRIAFSAAFRRLQDKTQVFPLPGNDYVRTRLTHSLECSCVGRSLGTMVGEFVVNSGKIESGYASHDFGSVVAAACLAHDIGNPPFGHTGEDALRHWVIHTSTGRMLYRNLLRQEQKADFINFEGNAQGFRVLTRLQSPSNPGGMQLTCATLATFSKYPRGSILRQRGQSSVGKFGFFDNDRDLFSKVAKETGLIKKGEYSWARHPLAFLVEAADDICYHIVDIEDGYKLGCISFGEVAELLKNISQKTHWKDLQDNEAVEYLRATAIGQMIEEVVTQFINNHDEILAGRFDEELTKLTDCCDSFASLKKVAKQKVYSNRDVVEVEAAGFNVLGTLMTIFFEAMEQLNSCQSRGIAPTPWARTILKLVPESYVGNGGVSDKDIYNRALRIFDYVSGMTDSYAVSVYKKIQGISLVER